VAPVQDPAHYRIKIAPGRSKYFFSALRATSVTDAAVVDRMFITAKDDSIEDARICLAKQKY